MFQRSCGAYGNPGQFCVPVSRPWLRRVYQELNSTATFSSQLPPAELLLRLAVKIGR